MKEPAVHRKSRTKFTYERDVKYWNPLHILIINYDNISLTLKYIKYI